MNVYRFAPSPNGELHLGHALSALLNADLARRGGGRLLLRIEDIDVTRCTPAFEAGIYDDLAWLGVDWEKPVRRQSEHFAAYAEALERLKGMGLVYPAFMSRGEARGWIADYEAQGKAWPRDPDGATLYPPPDRSLNEAERQRRINAGEPFAWRLDMAAAITSAPAGWRSFDPATGAVSTVAANPADWGDVILARADIPTSYHLSVVLDDALQGVTHVVRGLDLYQATSVHRLLQALLGLPEPLYHHHRLVLDADGRKLSKSERSTGLRALREAGATPQGVRAMLDLDAG
ncbi:tRNA glutamyl-Q(34) synthetase GluQRS [Salmonella enterica subsp. enterica serovar Virchow]|nr:tRNA glutamyl-Q(34) synthetase GluQRS [Salmonella enterica subsp. enterica serovar Virchow]